jgi:hypothetical protein
METAAHQLLIHPVVGAAETDMDVPDLGFRDQVVERLGHQVFSGVLFFRTG